jgi:hypothetical protein
MSEVYSVRRFVSGATGTNTINFYHRPALAGEVDVREEHLPEGNIHVDPEISHEVSALEADASVVVYRFSVNLAAQVEKGPALETAARVVEETSGLRSDSAVEKPPSMAAATQVESRPALQNTAVTEKPMAVSSGSTTEKASALNSSAGTDQTPSASLATSFHMEEPPRLNTAFSGEPSKTPGLRSAVAIEETAPASVAASIEAAKRPQWNADAATGKPPRLEHH